MTSAQKICRALPSPHVQINSPTFVGPISSTLVQLATFPARVGCQVIVQIISAALPSYYVTRTIMVMESPTLPFVDNH